MLTPDQIRLRLDAIHYHESDIGMADMVTLLYELLPELVALANGRTADDAGKRYGGGVPGRMWQERNA